MDFEELQVVWNNQHTEKLYAINESALHAYIQRKGRFINRLLTLFEFAVIGANLFAGITLLVVAIAKKNPAPQFTLVVFYLTFVVYGLIRRLRRGNEEKPFEPTLLGELHKAIWRIEYLKKQSRNIILWYLLPLTLIVGIMSFFNTSLVLAAGLLFLTVPVSYVAQHWEFKKFHLPNKHNLETLRDTLIAQENQ